MTLSATGTFEVTMKPLSEPDIADGVTLGRMSIDKRLEGDLIAVGKGEMLSALTGVDGSAGYVAIERIRGTLNGRQGSFVLQHTGVMNRGEQQLRILVVPDSGTEELAGISGEFAITIDDGQHRYAFDYTLPE